MTLVTVCGWLHNPLRKKGLLPILQSPWEGPYEVLQVLSDVTYKIRRDPQQRPRVVHVDRLWQYHGPGLFFWTEGGPEGVEEESEAEWEDQPMVEGELQHEADGPATREEATLPRMPEVGRSRRSRRVPEWTKDYVI